MRAGELRHVLTIEDPGETTGDAAVSYTVVATVRGRVEGLGARERSGLSAEADYRVTIRYLEGIKSRMRIGLNGRKLAIVGVPVDPDGRRRELVMLAMEKV